MDVVQAGTIAAIFLIKAMVILAILYLPFRFGSQLLIRLDDRGLFSSPYVLWLTLGCGALNGGLILYFNLGFDCFTFDAVFRTDGPWVLTFHQFIFDRINPLEYSLQPLIDHFGLFPGKTDLTSIYFLIFGVFALISVRAIWLWRSLGALRGIVCTLLIGSWATYMALFGLSLLLWLANLMNFWLLLPLTYVVHLGRNAQPGAWNMSDVAFGSFGTHAGSHGAHPHEIGLEDDEPQHEDHHGGASHGGHGGHHDQHASHGAAGHGAPHAQDNVHPLKKHH